MNKQFFYAIVQDDKTAPTLEGSFAVNKVIRTVEYEPGKIVVLLDDFHEEQGKRQAPKANGKGLTLATFKETVYSSIYLNEEDSARYKGLVEVGAPAQVQEAV